MPRIQNVQINDLIEEVLGIMAQQAKYGNVTIRRELTTDLPFVDMSPTEFQQVFLNLINNALYAMASKGGSLDVITRLADSAIVVEVSDNGPGIPNDNLVRIFDPFFTTKPVGKGTGLGLSICYGIIKKMGGDIDVQSVVGLGTTFSVKIPVGQHQVNEAG